MTAILKLEYDIIESLSKAACDIRGPRFYNGGVPFIIY